MTVIFILLQESFLEFKYYLGYSLSSQYKQDRELIEPYFDEKFYLSRYGAQVRKSGLSPLDHFLKRGWYSNDWRKHTDPNSWFNTTLWTERLWDKTPGEENKNDKLFSIFHIKINPFVAFLKQPKIREHHKNIEVWAKKNEMTRAWLAVEGLLRLDSFNVTLHVTQDVRPEDLKCFTPQVQRGLKLLLDNRQNKSFFYSDFIRHPTKYKLLDLNQSKNTSYADPMVYEQQEFVYLRHNLYSYTHWLRVGRINPIVINIARYCDEPLAAAPFLGNFSQRLAIILKGIIQGKIDVLREYRMQSFKDYLVRIADGFDLYLLDFKLPVQNLKIIPGCMSTWINEQELNKNKEFAVSFLLTKQVGRSNKWNYKFREEIWLREKDFTVPTNFYLSYRDKDNFSKNLQDRVMPTYSKKWIFDSQFNIAIENTRQEYYFTEKLLGCFVSLVIPIYLGCPNVYDYFDSRGMFVVQSVEEIIKVVSTLTPETYPKMLPYLKENKKRALRLLNLEKETIAEFGKKLR